MKLDTESAATLFHAFVTSGVHYCNLLLATDKLGLQRVVNAAARVVIGTRKYNWETAPSFWAALARCGRSGHIQAVYDNTQPIPRPPVRGLHAGLPSCQLTTPSFGQLPPTWRAKNIARYVRPSCVRRVWSDRLELTRQWSVWSTGTYNTTSVVWPMS